MANVWNLINVTTTGLRSGTTVDLPNSSAWWRVARPQPFNVISPTSPTPASGQIWPRGTEQG